MREYTKTGINIAMIGKQRHTVTELQMEKILSQISPYRLTHLHTSTHLETLKIKNSGHTPRPDRGTNKTQTVPII